MKTENEIDWKEAYLSLKNQLVATEHARSDLMGLNEELRARIRSLELGQEDLIQFVHKLRKKPIPAQEYHECVQCKRVAYEQITIASDSDSLPVWLCKECAYLLKYFTNFADAMDAYKTDLENKMQDE